MAARTEDVDTLLERIPDPAIRALFTREFVLCNEHFDRFTNESVLRLVHELGFEDRLARGTSASELVACARLRSPRAEIPLRWFLRKLAAAGYLDAEGPPEDAVYRSRGPLPPGDPDRAEAAARALDPGSLPAFAVVRAMVEHVPAFLAARRRARRSSSLPRDCRSGSTTSRTTTCSTRSTTAWARKPWRAPCRRRGRR